MHGKGEYTNADGSRYVGRFQAGKKDGKGTLLSDAGEVKQEWRNGVKIEDY